MNTNEQDLLPRQVTALIEGESSVIANLANVSALLFQELADINWVGFYLRDGDELVLGPFQGKPACVRIRMGSGVCGTAAQEQRTLRVPNVHAFDGHIACDPESMSELVVPLLHGHDVLGVLDIDSPLPDRFSAEEQSVIEQCAQIIQTQILASTPEMAHTRGQ